MNCSLSEVQIEKWRRKEETRRADKEHIASHERRDEKRHTVRKEMLVLLDDFLTGEVTLEQFRATYDHKTRSDWDSFGFKGMSGAMFLNTLVKYIPDHDEVATRLRRVLPVPQEEGEGRKKMQAFHGYLSGLVRAGQISRRQVQPARIPFFVGGWWHLQDVQQWPVFYTSGRRALKQAGVYEPSGDAVTDYFHFRACFLNLSRALELPSWQLEHLLAWADARKGKTKEAEDTEAVVAEPEEESADDDVEETAEEALSHAHIQWLLARIGHSLGCRVWIASNDHSKTWNGERLGDLSIADLPPHTLDSESQKIIKYIDVIWIQGRKRIVAAFEVEHTTSIYSGLLRMSDLVALSPNLNFPMYIVAPEERMEKVRRQLSRPTFQMLQLHEQCGFFSFEDLHREAQNIMTWANDPSAIENLATKVEGVEERWT